MDRESLLKNSSGKNRQTDTTTKQRILLQSGRCAASLLYRNDSWMMRNPNRDQSNRHQQMPHGHRFLNNRRLFEFAIGEITQTNRPSTYLFKYYSLLGQPCMSSQFKSSEVASSLAQAAVELRSFVDSLARTAQVLSEVAERLGDGRDGKNPCLTDSESGTEDGDRGSDSDASWTDDRVFAKTTPKPSGAPVASAYDKLTQPESSGPPSNARVERGDTLALSGCYYVVLEEEFDVLPLVATYASNSQRTVCYTAIPESIAFWRNLLAAIVDDSQVRILTPTRRKIGRLAQTLGALAASSTPWFVLLVFRFLAKEACGDCLPECAVFWGLPSARQVCALDLRKVVEQTRHTCIILTQDEYARSEIQQTLASLSATEHPFNFGSNDILSSVRSSLIRVLSEPQHQAQVRRLYESFLTYHRTYRTRPYNWTPLELAQHANSFAAKVLLHGRAEDGSSRFKPVGQRLEVPAATIHRLGLEEAVREGLLLQKGIFEGSGGPSLSLAKARTKRPSNQHSYVVLEEDFDAIPLISYLADKHPKTICFISHNKSISPYKAIFRKITAKQVIRPGKKKKSMTKGVQKFIRSESSLLLLRGDTGTPRDIKGVVADAVIHWGLPSKGCFIEQVKLPKSPCSYLILPMNEKTAATNLVVCNSPVQAHPESTQLTAYGPKSPILPYRKKTRAVLRKVKPESLKKAYVNQLSRPAVSKLEGVRRANRFAARVLLHGEPEDGSEVYKPIGPRLKVSRKAAYSRGLQVAVTQGLVLLDA